MAVTGIDFHSVCPHHLLPSRGVAHVALPARRKGGRVRAARAARRRPRAPAGAARRTSPAQIADALVAHLGARGAACVLDAEQLCMTVRGERRARARAHAEACAGALARDGAARRRFQASSPAAPARRGRRRAGGRDGERDGSDAGERSARTAIVTGGGRGIGAAVARALTGARRRA